MGNENTNNFFLAERRRNVNEQQQQKLDEILKKHEYKSNLVIAIMQDVQKEYHYLPEEALCYIAKELKMSEAKIYGVATFYENFSLEPKGKFVIKICDGTACHVRKSVPILEEFRKTLGVTQEKQLLMICFLLLKRYLVWEPVVWHRYVR